MLCKTHKKRCPYCLSYNLRSKGKIHKSNTQRYKCFSCKKHISLKGKLYFVSDEQLELINRLLFESLSLRGISRVIKLSLSWLMSYVKRLCKDQPEDLNYRPPNVSENDFQLTVIELDEMWSFVSEKSNKQGIWVAQYRKTRQVITFHIGKRGKKDAKILWDKLPEKIKKNGFFYSDDWDAYKHAIPKNQD